MKNLKQIGLTILKVLGVIFIIFFIIGIFSSTSKESVEPIDKVEIRSLLKDETKKMAEDPTKILRDEYVKGCAAGDKTMINFCTCSFNYLNKTLKDTGFVNLSMRMLDDSLTEADIDLMVDAILACQNNL
ncbi:MAG: hypothetical protein WC175_03505 [Candidatus Dojkabacteria bacterium]